jgi:hypothetical protein
VAFSAQFGELDDIRPYLSLGRKQRLPFLELFDVSNLEDDGSLVKIGSKRHDMGKVRIMNGELKLVADLLAHRGMVSTTWIHHLVNHPSR